MKGFIEINERKMCQNPDFVLEGPCGTNEVCFVFTVPLCDYWSVFTDPSKLMKCIYRPCGTRKTN